MRKLLKYTFYISLLLGVILAGVGATVGMYYYNRYTRDLPQIDRISDYHPKAVTTFYAADGTIISEVFDERRYPVKSLDEVPKVIQNAFLAAEDANFYNHPGVDFVSVLRAIYINMRKGTIKQGASTITQQVVKALLLDRAKKYERKVKEAILSYRIEKALTKREIFTIYLNEIFLGNTAYGVKAAAKVHFHKELEQVNLAEAAFLASLPKEPTSLIQPANRKRAIERQQYVLDQMLKNRMISESERQAALKTDLVFYPSETLRKPGTEYYVDHAMTVLAEKLSAIDRRLTPRNPGGFQVYTSLDLDTQKMAIAALQRGLREVDKRRGWRGPLSVSLDPQAAARVPSLVDTQAVADRGVLPGQLYSAVVKEIRRDGGAVVQVGNFTGVIELKKATWAQRLIDRHDRVVGVDLTRYLKPGQIVEVSLDPEKEKESVAFDQQRAVSFVLDQTPELEGALYLQNVLSGEVKAIVGGYDYRRSEFNRATQGTRQPGSSFKPFVYLAALDTLHYTPSSIVPDSPISLVAGNGKLWTPGNFDGKFLGPITVRTALQKSRNVVSVYLANKMGLDAVIDAARKLGITTPIGRDMSISLGTSEVKLSELVGAYSVFAAGGLLTDPIVVRQVKDRDGKVVYDQRPNAKMVISEETAFIMAHMMKGVVERGTATILKKLERPVAGKTGTTNEEMDAWFVGFTPEWAGGIWVGFDVKRQIGHKETGGKVAAPIFLYFMQEFLKDTPPLDFVIPDGVVPVTVNVNSGRPTSDDDPGAFVEYFKSGTETSLDQVNEQGGDSGLEGGGDPDVPQDYLSNDEF